MNLPQMKGGLSIDVVAQEVAIYVRGAQVYSRATRAVDATATDYRSYGLHFNTLSGSRFILWADRDGSVTRDKINPDYNYNVTDGAAIETYDLPKGFMIFKVLKYCNQSPVVATRADIVFTIPDPEANFVADGTSCTITSLGLCLKSPNFAQYRLIKTFNNGQISVENPSVSGECN